jgi:TRAP-type C4-dicarboxylate transport system permease small subunit
LVGTVEFEELMIVILVFCGIACTQIPRNPISVDFVTAGLSSGMRPVVASTTAFASSLFFLAPVWQGLAWYSRWPR